MGWLPGQSGNPGGRPRARLDLLARERTAEAIATSVRVMRQKTNPAAAARAAEILLDRGWGRVENSGAIFNIASAERGEPPTQIKVSFVEGRRWPPAALTRFSATACRRGSSGADRAGTDPPRRRSHRGGVFRFKDQ